MIRAVCAALALPLALPIAACASVPPEEPSPAPSTGFAVVRIGGEVLVGGAFVRATRIVEDSRCPASVQCIRAGTVRVAVRIRDGGPARDAVLEVGRPQPLRAGREIRLTQVCPERRTGTPPAAASYVLRLAVSPAGSPPPISPVCAAP